MKLLHVIGTLNPSYGGPQEALRQITLALIELGHQSEVITLDSPDETWLNQFPGVVHALGPSVGKYRYNSKLVSWLTANANNYDAVVARGIWQFQSFAVRQAALKGKFDYYIFVHGALDPWFKHHYPLKHLKKWLYWSWGEYRNLRDAAAVFYTSEQEKILARQSFWLYRSNEVVVNYGTKSPGNDLKQQQIEAFYKAYPYLKQKRVLLFLSRIHAKKGCDLLIQAFVKVAKDNPALHLVMVGPDQDGWQAKLEKQAKSLGIGERITWTGMLSGDLKWGAYRAAEVFVLPSHSENFGIVVAEALACGLPVLITDKVNIWREIEAEKAGLVASDTLEGTISLLQQWLALDAPQRADFSQRAVKCFHKHFEIQQAAKSLIQAISSTSNKNGEKQS